MSRLISVSTFVWFLTLIFRIEGFSLPAMVPVTGVKDVVGLLPGEEVGMLEAMAVGMVVEGTVVEGTVEAAPIRTCETTSQE